MKKKVVKGKQVKTIQIKLDKARFCIPSHYDLPPSDEIFVKISIGSNVKYSSKRSYDDVVTFNEFFSISFDPKNITLQATVLVDTDSSSQSQSGVDNSIIQNNKSSGVLPVEEKNATVVGKFEVIIMGKERRFPIIKGIPCLLDQVLDGSKNNRGTLSVWITAKDFGEEPLQQPVDNSKRPNSSGSVARKKKTKHERTMSLKASRERLIGWMKKIGKKDPKNKSGKKKVRKKKVKKKVVDVNREETEEFVKMFAKADLFYPTKKEGDEITASEKEEGENNKPNTEGSDEIDNAENNNATPGTSPSKEKEKNPLGVKLKSLSLDSDHDFENLPKVLTQEYLTVEDTEKVHELPCFYNEKNPAGIYSGEVKIYKTMGGRKYLLPNGDGVMNYGKAKYVGSFQKGVRHGRGKIISNSNPHAFLDCQWQYDNCSGICVFHDEYNNLYEGTCKFFTKNVKMMKLDLSWFLKQGRGSFFNNDEGWVYSGDFNNNVRSGCGIIDFSDGRRYIGKWKGDKMDGSGCFVYMDGSYFYGTFKEGKRVGNGEYYLSNGYKIIGKWENSASGGSMQNCKIELKGVINDNVMRMVEREIGRQKRGFDTKQLSLRRSKFLWQSIVLRAGLEGQIEKMNFNMDTFYIGFNQNICLQLLEDNLEGGYLQKIVQLFVSYFISFYDSQDEKKNARQKRGEIAFTLEGKKNLLYARDDVMTFIEFISSELFEVIRLYKPKSEEITTREMKESMIEESPGGLDMIVDEVSERLDNNVKRVIESCVTNFVHAAIFRVIDYLYLENYKEEEVLFKQKINSIFHALGTIPNEMKLKYMSENINNLMLIPDMKKYQKRQVEAIKALLVSAGVKDEKIKVLNEQKFLKKMLNSVQLIFKQFEQYKDEEYTKVKENVGVFQQIVKDKFSTDSSVLIEKETLTFYEKLLKLTRVGLICSFELHTLDIADVVLKEFNKISSKKFTEFKTDLIKSMECQVLTSKYWFEFILFKVMNNDIDKKKKEIFSCSKNEKNQFDITFLKSLLFALDSVIEGFRCLGLPSYIQMTQLKKSSLKRLDSLKMLLSRNRKIPLEKKAKIVEYLEGSKMGNTDSIKEKYSQAEKLMREVEKLKVMSEGEFEVVMNRFLSAKNSVEHRHCYEVLSDLIDNFILQISSIKCQVVEELSIKELKDTSKLVLNGIEKLLQSCMIDLNFWNKNNEDDTTNVGFTIVLKRVASVKNIIELLLKPQLDKERDDDDDDVMIEKNILDVGVFFSYLQIGNSFISSMKGFSKIYVLPILQKIIDKEEKIIGLIKKSGEDGENEVLLFQNNIKIIKENLHVMGGEDKIDVDAETEKKKSEQEKKKIKEKQFSSLNQRKIRSFNISKIVPRMEIIDPKKNIPEKKIILPVVKQFTKQTFSSLESMLVNSVKCLEYGFTAISTSIECSEIMSSMKHLSVVFADTKEFLQSSFEKLADLSIKHKITACETSFKILSKLKKNNNKVKQIRLESFGVDPKFIPKNYFNSGSIPYSKSISTLKELSAKKTLNDKFNVLNKFEKSLHVEMCKITGKHISSMFEEDDILPLTLYCFLRSDLNHHAQYNYLNDWKISESGMLMRYDVFFKYIQNLDPYLRSDQGELLNVIGNIVNPIKVRLFKLTKDNSAGTVSIRWLINLLNLIYCEIGFLKKNQSLMIEDEGLEKNIKMQMEHVKFVLVSNIGFTVNLQPQNDDKLKIEFKNVYSPNIYKYISKEILKEFKDYM